MQNITKRFLEQKLPAFREMGTRNRHACGFMILFWLFIGMSWAFASFAQADGRPFEALTAEEQAWLDQNPDKLILVFNTTRPPIELSSAAGEFIGMAADIVARIEKRLNVVFVKRPSATWEEALYALKSGEVSLMPAIVKTGEREGFAFFTTPYTVLPVVIIGKRDIGTGITLDDLAGRRVSIVAGIAVEEYLRRRPGGRIQLIPMPHATQGLRAASLGQVDAFVENLGSAAYYIEREAIDNLQVIGTTEYIYELSIGVSRQYPLLFSAVQKALSDIPLVELENIRKQWISLQIHTGMSAEAKRLTALIAMFTALLLIALGLISYALKRRLNEKMASLGKNMELLRATFNATPDGILAVNKNLKVTHANSQFYKMWQIPPQLQKTDDDETLREFVLDQLEDPDGFQNLTDTLYHSRVQNRREILFKDGRVFDCYSAPMLLEGEEIGRVWDFRDISDQKRAEKEREKLQSQLLQSQKLEAVGILAGGVAHDFNNMLGAIIGYAELTLGRMDEANPFRKNLSKILDAARRSTDITRQLLAFARKQTISPVVFDLNGSVEAILKMIRRLIGENIDLAWLPGAGRFMVKMDPSQLDQIILNLCVNARDAIGGVGRVTIETDTVSFDEANWAPDSGVTPGEYVRLLVSDTGCGMDKETLAHIFEPFFTTKGLGQGTGMGLATIYGIIQQNKGFITVYSEPGTGTIFKIHIPMHTSGAETKKPKKDGILPLSRGETVLIVEDDSNFLEMTAMMLQGLGYSILSAQTPSEALRLAQENPSEIHLFITDVIMPEMNGRHLAEKLSMIRPKIKHLFMSGYTADVIAHQGVLDEGINFIQKPFMLKDLAVKIRGILG
ncbi:MAG: transporter substrate-binding domain-containing protein [Desulfobacteraceae bacterium]|nr:transporter substrate-binding domain-containing protein [Desulfobacteraceae bacterium]